MCSAATAAPRSGSIWPSAIPSGCRHWSRTSRLARNCYPDAAEQRALKECVYDTYRTNGVGPAMKKFQALVWGALGSRTRRHRSPRRPPEM
jgi:hypothetical protein